MTVTKMERIKDQIHILTQDVNGNHEVYVHITEMTPLEDIINEMKNDKPKCFGDTLKIRNDGGCDYCYFMSACVNAIHEKGK